jgi:predicted HAD superfamily Cof-like phosphohydrolase
MSEDIEKLENRVEGIQVQLSSLRRELIDPYRPWEDVGDLMVVAGQEMNYQPTIPSEQTLKLRAALVLEEALELCEACGFDVLTPEGSAVTPKGVRLYKMTAPDLVEIADALTDTLVVTYGGFRAFGIEVRPCWDEVHRSNSSKIVDGKMIKDANGKFLKPDTYSPPNLSRVLFGESYDEVQ